MNPVETIAVLRERYVNTDIDWELMLEFAYREILDRDSVVLDVGGHAGRHADVFARVLNCARVVVVEPLPGHAEVLRNRYADLASVLVIESALGLEDGTTDFVFNAGSPEESGIRQRAYNVPENAHLEELQVRLLRLDTLCRDLDRLDFIKIDTEGGEVDILLGGIESLSRFRPVLSVEYGSASYLAYGKKRSTLFDLAMDVGYFLYDPFGQRIADRHEWEQCCDSFYWDYLMGPSERDEALRDRLSGQWERLEKALK